MPAIKVRVIGLILVSPPLKFLFVAESAPRPGCSLAQKSGKNASGSALTGLAIELCSMPVTHHKRVASMFE
jgi:hypothetical protein